ncbi:hypothetical protein [Alsobacter soli]|uniref:hypothetical protein n=1 Tax=Alsobacter soli TaxID=2109933 RepID=UPI001AECEC91|nr:hypothetical protein [Alsobacter soli]
MSHELLGVLGIIVSVTMATVSQIVFALNSIEEKLERQGFIKTRSGVKGASYALIYLFVVALLVVLIKPITSGSPTSEAGVNALALLILIWNVLILHSILDLIFSLGPIIKVK